MGNKTCCQSHYKELQLLQNKQHQQPQQYHININYCTNNHQELNENIQNNQSQNQNNHIEYIQQQNQHTIANNNQLSGLSEMRKHKIKTNPEQKELVIIPQLPSESKMEYHGYTFKWKSFNHDKNKLEGHVKVSKEQKLVFEGEYRNSQRNGFGIEYGEQSEVMYEGMFRNDKYDGWGVKQTKTDKYVGEFREGLYDDFGFFVSSDQIYQGYFKEGKYDGLGIILKGNPLRTPEIKSMKQFLLSLVDNQMKDMQKYNINEVYIGEWSHGMKNGHGKLWKPNNYWYVGQFAQNLYHGIGALHNPGKENSVGVVKGIFRNGKHETK